MVLTLILFGVNFTVLCALGWWFWKRLDGVDEVPLHFNLRGIADRYGPKWLAVGIMPMLYALIGGVSLAASLLPMLEPESRADARNGVIAIGPIFALLYLGIVWLTLQAIVEGKQN
ncbi:MAG: DUF1648 domain-containing protein [Novosphingobium sp.]